MRLQLFIAVFIATHAAFAQSSESNLFQQSFEGMFEIEPVDIHIPEGIQGPQNPAVPIDGGLTALLLAGSAVGYRKYRSVKSKHSA